VSYDAKIIKVALRMLSPRLLNDRDIPD